MPQTWQGKHRCQSAYTSLQVGAKDFTLTKKKRRLAQKESARPHFYSICDWILGVRRAMFHVSHSFLYLNVCVCVLLPHFCNCMSGLVTFQHVLY